MPFSRCLVRFEDACGYSHPETTKLRWQAAGFVSVGSSLEPAPTQFESSDQYTEFVSKVILHRHLERLPNEVLRRELLQALAEQAAKDRPPYELDYWRLNLNARKPE